MTTLDAYYRQHPERLREWAKMEEAKIARMEANGASPAALASHRLLLTRWSDLLDEISEASVSLQEDNQ